MHPADLAHYRALRVAALLFALLGLALLIAAPWSVSLPPAVCVLLGLVGLGAAGATWRASLALLDDESFPDATRSMR